MIYIGIDQTGAINRNGVPRALPACILRENSITFVNLEQLSRQHLLYHLSKTEIRNARIGLDCVLGIPQDLGISWRTAATWSLTTPGYGRQPAREFFHRLGLGTRHQRKIEIQCKANSVFDEHPFQKNIQTGTFRLWKELASTPEDFFVPYLEKRKHKQQIPVYEGYPTLAWKLIFDVKKRSPERLSDLLKLKQLANGWTKRHQSQVDHDPNLGDAFVLALAVRDFSRSIPYRAKDQEGWILGYHSYT